MLDRVRGGPVSRHYDDVRAHVEDGRPVDDVLDELLDHAVGTTTFYEPFAGRGLEAFPVIDKAVVRAHEPAFRSATFEGARLHRKRTSGSTGTPFAVDWDVGKRRRAIADVIYFNERAGQRLGDRLMWLYAARLLPMSRWQRFSQNIIPVDHVGLDDRRKASIVETLRQGGVNGVLSISSTLDALARAIQARGVASDELGVNVVISSGEQLSPQVKLGIEAAFGCPVVDRYANEECGLLACGRPGDGRLRLNRASFRFEFLRPDSDDVQVPGEPARIVVTDLYSRAMPLIRYDTGDLAVVAATDADGEAVALERIEGRRADVIYDTSGGQVSGTSVSGIMAKVFPAVERFQLIQDGAGSYRLSVVPADVPYGEAELAAELRRWLGADADVRVALVPDIPSLPSGKHRPVICEAAPPSAQRADA